MSESPSTQILRLGTRGSLLARSQSGLVAASLEKHHPGLKVKLVVIKTSGDQIAEKPLHDLGGKGLFTRELEQALLAGDIDLAVHSFKDVPVTMPLVEQSDLVIAAVPAREDPRDVLISPIAKSLADFAANARLGTGSLRRRCQILARRPDVQVLPIRGNIDTRLRKLEAGDFDGIVLALAGLKRAGLYEPQRMQPFDPGQLLPAPGQGALALQCRRADSRTRQFLEPLNDPATFACVRAERELVRLLQGDCHSPIAALAELQDRTLALRAVVGARDGGPPVIAAKSAGPAQSWQSIAQAVYDDLQRQGVVNLLHGG